MYIDIDMPQLEPQIISLETCNVSMCLLETPGLPDFSGWGRGSYYTILIIIIIIMIIIIIIISSSSSIVLSLLLSLLPSWSDYHSLFHWRSSSVRSW